MPAEVHPLRPEGEGPRRSGSRRAQERDRQPGMAHAEVRARHRGNEAIGRRPPMPHPRIPLWYRSNLLRLIADRSPAKNYRFPSTRHFGVNSWNGTSAASRSAPRRASRSRCRPAEAWRSSAPNPRASPPTAPSSPTSAGWRTAPGRYPPGSPWPGR